MPRPPRTEADKPGRALQKLAARLSNPNLSYYEVLGIAPRAARSDPGALGAARRALLTTCHPDRFANVPDTLSVLAHDTTALVNVAHDTLTDPAARGRYEKTVLNKTHYACRACAGEGEKKVQRGFSTIQWVKCEACEGVGYRSKGDY
jgi:DnaJ-class molecular chaperone